MNHPDRMNHADTPPLGRRVCPACDPGPRRASPTAKCVLSFLLCALCASVVSPSAFAQRDAKVPDPDPELERKSFQVAPGFEVNL
ncbi:MAG TPA: hypothetical protein VFA26_23410, partial [Gemmataceae bacterium]|nr:hypothetical protein [Gemmataceae bacterium]